MLSFSHQQYGPENAGIRSLFLNAKNWETLAPPGLLMGAGEMDEMCSVLNAHLVTCVSSPGVALK